MHEILSIRSNAKVLRKYAYLWPSNKNKAKGRKKIFLFVKETDIWPQKVCFFLLLHVHGVMEKKGIKGKCLTEFTFLLLTNQKKRSY